MNWYRSVIDIQNNAINFFIRDVTIEFKATVLGPHLLVSFNNFYFIAAQVIIATSTIFIFTL